MRELLLDVLGGPFGAPDAETVWPSPSHHDDASPFSSAAVLVPLVAHPGGMTVLLTQRTETLRAHAGQISFPGGRFEPGDVSPEDTALRETEEEIGVARHHVELIGRLTEHETGTGFRVVPVVGLLRPPVAVTVDPGEVDHAFEAPLDFLLDPANHKVETRRHNGVEREFCVVPWGDYHIWGLTARVLFELSRKVRKA